MDQARTPLTHAQAARLCEELQSNVERALRGKHDVIERAVVCLLAGGHLLLEDVPGVGKTTLARALAQSVGGQFNRIQFTSDLLPSDLTGMSVPEMIDGRATPRFAFAPGPLFANVVLADEVNRANPKSQSALLEAMGEATVSVDGITHSLPDPFFVVATQNPLEHSGTHPLPESQLDRFLMRLTIGYPDRTHEADVLRAVALPRAEAPLETVIELPQLAALQRTVEVTKIEDSVVGYLLAIVEATRESDALELGASTRGALCLRRAAGARAVIQGRDYCIPEDVASLAVDVLAHRVALATRGAGRSTADEARWIVSDILDRVPVPL